MNENQQVNEIKNLSVIMNNKLNRHTSRPYLKTNVPLYKPKQSIRDLEHRLSNKFMKTMANKGELYRRNYNVENKMEIFA